MSSISVNTITDASGGATTSINGFTPSVSNMAGRNRIINGDMRIDQRNAGASVTAGSGYTLDRWNVDRVWAGSTVTIQQSSTAPSGFSNSMVATVSTGAAVASSSYFSIQQYIEGNNLSDMDFGKATAKTFTVSFWVRSSLTGTFGVGFRNSAFDLSYWTTYTINAANTWEQKSVTITAPVSGTWYTNNSYGLNLIFSLGCGSTYKTTANNEWVSGNKLGAIGETDLIATTGATFYITGVQLEEGSVATPFEHRQYGQELALCQRYYQQIGGFTTWSGSQTTNVGGNLTYSMRAAPTLGQTGTITITEYSVNDWAQSSIGISIAGGGTRATNNAVQFALSNYSGLNAYRMQVSIVNTGAITLSAEL